jgi:hypothetical protein
VGVGGQGELLGWAEGYTPSLQPRILVFYQAPGWFFCPSMPILTRSLRTVQVHFELRNNGTTLPLHAHRTSTLRILIRITYGRC